MPSPEAQADLFTYTEADYHEGHRRLREALGAIDVKTAEVLACHIVVTRAVEQVLGELTPRADLLKNLSLEAKMNVLLAFSDNEGVHHMAKPVAALVRLRNVVAHQLDKRAVRSAFRKLCDTFGLDAETATVSSIAHVIVTGLGIVEKETSAAV